MHLPIKHPRNIIRITLVILVYIFSTGVSLAQTEEYDEDDEDTFQLEADTSSEPQFNEISSWNTPQPVIRRVPDSLVNKLQKLDVFWYANEEWIKPRPEPRKRNGFMDTKWFKSLMWILIIGAFLAAIVWYLATTNFSYFRRKPAAVISHDNEPTMENIFEINYEREIGRAIDAKNFRLATRLLFLQVLKQLSEQNIIRYKQDRTNFDYLMQVYNTGYYKDFFRLTRNYEFAWYGKQDPGEDGFNIIQRDFEKFHKQLKYQ